MKQSAFQRLMRTLLTLLGAGIGVGIGVFTTRMIEYTGSEPDIVRNVCIYGGLVLLFGVLFFLIAPAIVRAGDGNLRRVMRGLDDIPTGQMVGGVVGMLMGLAVAFLLSPLFNALNSTLFTTVLSVILYAVLGYVGLMLGMRRLKDVGFWSAARRAERRQEKAAQHTNGRNLAKILDTSVIVDGRIFDICKTGFVEGTLIIPQFVLAELRHIADSSDTLRRNRGRRGLDVLMRIQKELEIPVEIEETDYEDVTEVDVKLLRLARQLDGIVVTNDYNLNKVASVTGVKVLNINELANAIKPVVLPGEEMSVMIVREGKEPGQGVAYLDDGTMIVVDNARRHVGEVIEVIVTTVLQTSAGRMIFTRIKDLENKAG